MRKNWLSATRTPLILLALVVSTPAFSGPIVIGVIDLPSDLEHPMIAPYVAPAASGQTNPFYTRNRELLRRYTGSLGLASDESGRPRNSGAIRSELKDAFGNSPSRPELRQSLRSYLHGSLVDSLTVNGLDPSRFKLEHFPREFETDWRTPPAECRLKLAKWLDAISHRIKTDGIRVINMSFRLEPDLGQARQLLNNELRASGMSFSSIHDAIEPRIQKLKEQADISRSEYRRFFLENPQTAFVLASGNDTLEINGDANAELIEAPNLIRVAATDYRGNLARFSSWSPRSVQIAAPGINMPGACVGGGLVRNNGTSFAGPMVTRQVGKVFEQTPSLSGAEAIQVLLEKYTLPLDGLRPFINGGRFLLPPGKANLTGKILPESFDESDWIKLSCSARLSRMTRIGNEADTEIRVPTPATAN